MCFNLPLWLAKCRAIREYPLRKNNSHFSTNLNNSRAMSMSAPSAINTDFSTVKFDDETTEWNNTGTSQVKSTMSHRLLLISLKQNKKQFLKQTRCYLRFYDATEITNCRVESRTRWEARTAFWCRASIWDQARRLGDPWAASPIAPNKVRRSISIYRTG